MKRNLSFSDRNRELAQFKPGMESSRSDWISWKRAFEIYARATGVDSQQRKKDLLLHMGGSSLQRTYFLLPGATEEAQPEYEQPYLKCIELLDAFYAPKLNRQHESYKLRSIEQGQEEKFDNFIQRIRAQIEKCEFQQETADLMTVLQILSGVKSNETRKKILETERSVEEAIAIGRHDELVKENMRSYNSDRPENITTNVQRVVKVGNETQSQSRVICYSCNRQGHFSKSIECPARNRRCDKCNVMGHFAICCKGRKRTTDDNYNKGGFPNKRVRLIRNDEEYEDRNFIFYMGGTAKLKFTVGERTMELKVDSGSDITVISGKTWQSNKQHMKYKDYRTIDNMKCFGYEKGQEPITILCTFVTSIEFKGRVTEEKIYVAPNGTDDLIGFKAATALKTLFVGDVEQLPHETVNKIVEKQKFPKIEGYQVKLEIDRSVKPVQQQFRKIPQALEEKVEEKITELLENDIIEKITGPQSWLSPVVPIIKPNGELRLCVDLRRANEAIKTGFYAFDSIDDILFSICKPKKMSKLDMSNAYYLFELEEDSRDITAFAVKSGRYRFKRLTFGIKSAPEEFCKGMDMIFNGLKGI